MEKNWKEKVIDVGVVPAGSTQEFIFEATSKLKITKLAPSCGCTNVSYDKKKKTLTATMKVGKIPFHLMHVNKKSFNKSITVFYEDGTSEVLYIKAIVKAKL